MAGVGRWTSLGTTVVGHLYSDLSPTEAWRGRLKTAGRKAGLEPVGVSSWTGFETNPPSVSGRCLEDEISSAGNAATCEDCRERQGERRGSPGAAAAGGGESGETAAGCIGVAEGIGDDQPW